MKDRLEMPVVVERERREGADVTVRVGRMKFGGTGIPRDEGGELLALLSFFYKCGHEPGAVLSLGIDDALRARLVELPPEVYEWVEEHFDSIFRTA